LVIRFILVVAILIAVPSSSTPPAFEAEGIQRFFSAFTSAWSVADPHEIVRFYDVDVDLPDSHSDNELNNPAGYWYSAEQGAGQIWFSNRLGYVTKPRARTLEGAFVDGKGAFVIMSMPDLGAALGYVLDVGAVRFTRQIELRWRDARKATGAPDQRLAWADDLISRYVSHWADPGSTDPLYTPDASITVLTREVAAPDDDRLRLRSAQLEMITTGDNQGSSVFFAPGNQLEDRPSDVLAFTLRAEVRDGCVSRIAVLLDVAGGQITSERRMFDADSMRRCGYTNVTGWWQGLAIPPPVEAQRTGTVRSAVATPVFNGSPPLEALFSWSMSRFDATSLPRPAVASVSFGALEACGSRAGVIVDSAINGPGVVLCTDGHTVCRPNPVECSEFARTARFGMLHELAHVWLLEHMTPSRQQDFMDVIGSKEWQSPNVPWGDRGAEQAAEILAWGLMDQPLDLVRIGSPSCEVRLHAYSVLTGATSFQVCA
jgi:hypothetical protein